MKLLSVIAVVGAVLVAGGIGYFVGCKDVAAMPRQITTKPLQLQTSPEARGQLPQGTSLYEYRALGETTIYCAFISLKERNVLTPVKSGDRIVAPVSAYDE